MPILSVAMANSLSTARWVGQLVVLGQETYVFPSSDDIPVPPEMCGVVVSTSGHVRQKGPRQGVRLKGFSVGSEIVTLAVIKLLEKRCPDHRLYLSQKSPGLAETVLFERRDGLNVRDRLYVEDDCRVSDTVLRTGTPAQVCNVGGGSELSSINVVHPLLSALAQQTGKLKGDWRRLVTFVLDRSRHYRGYAIEVFLMTRDSPFEDARQSKALLAATASWIQGRTGETREP